MITSKYQLPKNINLIFTEEIRDTLWTVLAQHSDCIVGEKIQNWKNQKEKHPFPAQSIKYTQIREEKFYILKLSYWWCWALLLWERDTTVWDIVIHVYNIHTYAYCWFLLYILSKLCFYSIHSFISLGCDEWQWVLELLIKCF